ncbi:DUF2971 domain-containing protein [Cohnella phaseoli]|nr:DUF2971 domain-containing protein [Cohnella phaseoli]
MDEFDLEKYRIENPMDYLKAVQIIKEIPNNSEIMKVIYQITRLHIPDVVYKYYSLTSNDDLNEIKMKTLTDKKIYLADASTLNDPFEGKAFFYNHKRLAHYESLRPVDGKIIDDFTSFIRLTSLTGVGTNCMPMWAHYANNHSGFCVEYDTKNKENLTFRSSLFPVQYLDKRIDITEIMESLMTELEIAKSRALKHNMKKVELSNMTILWASIYYSCLKHESWSYEKEMRIVTSSVHRFINAQPSAIYVGVNCTRDYLHSLGSIAQKLQIPIYQMHFDEYSLDYKLNSKKLD